MREARRAFRKFYATCFWSYRADLTIGSADVEWVAETLRKNGDRRAWREPTMPLTDFQREVL